MASGVARCRCGTFFPMTAGTGSQIDLPLDLPTDLALSKIALPVHNPTGKAAEFAAVIFGPCVNPSFQIGGNTYAVDAAVPEGGRIFHCRPPDYGRR